MQNISRIVVDRVLMKNSFSNIYYILLLAERFFQSFLLVLAATGMNGLATYTYKVLRVIGVWI